MRRNSPHRPRRHGGCIAIASNTRFGAPYMPSLAANITSACSYGCSLMIRPCGAGMNAIKGSIRRHFRQRWSWSSWMLQVDAVSHERDCLGNVVSPVHRLIIYLKCTIILGTGLVSLGLCLRKNMILLRAILFRARQPISVRLPACAHIEVFE